MAKGDVQQSIISSSIEIANDTMFDNTINHKQQKYPCCIVWTPIPCLTWLFPFIGHMGIGTSAGVIKDFAGPYHVGSGDFAFGKPTKYLQFSPMRAIGGVDGWDKAIGEASDIYKGRMHNLCCDNCHSYVAMALNKMSYNNSNWNMVKLAVMMCFKGKFVGPAGILKTLLPCIIMIFIILMLILMV